MAGKALIRWGVACWLALGAFMGGAQAVVPPLDQPSWAKLVPEQRAILTPLAKEWDAMDAFQRKKWLGIAQRYPSMSPAEQASMQRNMRDWARLAPEERKAAREKYKKLKKIPPEQQRTVKEQWEEYRALPREERQLLRESAARTPKVKTPAKHPAASSSGHSSMSPSITPPRSPLSPIKPPQSTLVPKPGKPAAPATPKE
jgi:hypothetical protein